MNYNFYFFIIIYVFNAAFICQAMEDASKKDSFAKILTQKQTRFAQYLTNNYVVFAGDSFLVKKLSKINVLTKEIEDFNDIPNPTHQSWTYGTMHPNKEDIILSDGATIDIFNIKTNILKRTKDICVGHYSPWVFNPLNNETIFMIYTHCFGNHAEFIKYNYVTDKKEATFKYTVNEQNHPTTFAMHPKQPLVCITHSNGDIYIHNSNDLTVSNAITLPKKGIPNLCQYNCNGSLLAIGNTYPDEFNNENDTIFIIESKPIINTDDHSSIIPYHDRERIEKIIFHPTNHHVLAVVSRIFRYTSLNQIFLRFWDTQTVQLIGTSKALGPQYCYDLSFSPSGTEILITLNNKCIIMPVPFEVIKDQALCIYQCLKNYRFDQQQLPFDIIQCIITQLRATCLH